MTARLDAQIDFLKEADKLKSVVRASKLISGERRENSAEHSWHIMLHALVLADQAGPEVRIDRVLLRMLLLHDLVEIDAGDAPIHGNPDHEEMARKEAAAARRLFGLLPGGPGRGVPHPVGRVRIRRNARRAVRQGDRPVSNPVINLENGGGTWRDYNVTLEQLDSRVGVPIRRGAPGLWDWLRPKLAAFFSRLDGTA